MSHGEDPLGRGSPDAIRPLDGSPNTGERDSLGQRVLERSSAIVLVLLGLAFVVGAAQLPLGSLREPGPGLWPLAVGVAIVVLGAVSGLQGDRSMPALNTAKAEFGTAGIAFAELIGFVLAYWYLGYFGATFLVVLVMGRTFSDVSWRRLLLVAVLFGAVMHAFFTYVLVLPPPHYLF